MPRKTDLKTEERKTATFSEHWRFFSVPFLFTTMLFPALFTLLVWPLCRTEKYFMVDRNKHPGYVSRRTLPLSEQTKIASQLTPNFALRISNFELSPMHLTDLIGTIGVSLLLLAFFLNLFLKLPKESYAYLLLNIAGAGLACFASVLLVYWPFIVLEAAWTVVSVAALLQQLKK